MEAQAGSPSPVLMLSSPTSCTKSIRFLSKCLRTLGAHGWLRTQTAPARRPAPPRLHAWLPNQGRKQHSCSGRPRTGAALTEPPPATPRPLRGGNAISRKPALGTQLGGGSLYLRGSKEYRKDHTETLEVPRELLGTVGDTRATVSHPPPTQGSRPDLSSHTRT